MDLKEELEKSLKELRKEKKRKFEQTVDLILNLHKINIKKNPINLIITIPNKIKEKKIAGFLETESKEIDTITPPEFKTYSNKNKLKELVKKYDFFIAQGSLMSKVATTFGRVLGPAGKMPSPQMGIILNGDKKTIEGLKEKINQSMKIKAKEPSIKIAIGKENMEDEKIIENILTVYNSILKILPRGKENIKNIEIKFTMTKPKKIYLKQNEK